MSKATCIVCDGPYAEQDRWGDEFPYWVVFAADDEGEPAGTVYECHSFEKAQNLTRKMATDRRLEIVNDASPA